MKMVNTMDKAYKKAIGVIKECSTEYGLFASGGRRGYKGVWSRDSVISFLGASLIKEKEYKDSFRETFKKSLEILGKKQSKKGQIPNAVYGFKKKKLIVDYLSIDSALWFIIGHYIYKKRYNSILFREQKKEINKAFIWLTYQDVGENLMLEQLPTTDWQDAFPHKYGRTINTQALYYRVLRLMGESSKARKLKLLVNKNKETKLWLKDFYASYRWKNHRKYKEIGNWFDSLGNLLAIIFDLTTKSKAEKIISYIKKKKIDKPYPVKSIYPPIKKGNTEWKDYYLDCDAGKPYHYLNAGIWTYIGGFYVLALIKLGKLEEAEEQLKELAIANLRGNFPEWIHPKTRRAYGKLQAWSAGTYILAYESLKKKKILI